MGFFRQGYWSGLPVPSPGDLPDPGIEPRSPPLPHFAHIAPTMLPHCLPLCLLCGRPGFHPWVRKMPWRRERTPTPVFWPREFHGLHSPWGRRESETTEWLSFSLSLSPTLQADSLPSKPPGKPDLLFLTVSDCVSSVQLLSRVWLFATPWITARQASLSIADSRSLFKLMSIESVMPSSHLILCRPLLLLPPNPSQHQGLFQWVNSSHEVAKVLQLHLQHQSFQWTPRTDL